MNTVGIIAMSLLGGVFFVALLAALGSLIVLHIRTQRAYKELHGIIEGTKASFTGIRQELKTSLETNAASTEAILVAHHQKFLDVVGKINATALERASIEAISAMRGLAKLSTSLQTLLVAHDVAPAANDLAPEEYGPTDTIYSIRSSAARADDIAQAADAADVTAEFHTGE